MSGNYVQLQNKARDVVEAITLLRARKIAQASADKEAVQASASYDMVVGDYEKRKTQVTSADEDKEKLSDDVAELRSQRAALITQKETSITVRDEAAESLAAKEEEVSDLLGEPADEVPEDTSVSPPVPAVPAKPSRGIHALRAEVETLVGEFNDLNNTLVTQRIDLEALNGALVALEKKLADLKEVRDSMLPGDVPPELTQEIADTQTEIDDKKTEISDLEEEIATTVYDVATKEAEIQVKNDEIEEMMSDYRRADRELKTERETYQEILAEFQNIANQLEDIEGSADPSAPTSDDNVTDADGAEGSRLYLAVDALDRITSVQSSYTYLRDSLSDAKIARKITLDAANRKKATADREVTSAEEDLVRLRKDLSVLISLQTAIEVEAAVSLLEDFLKNGSLITSSGPVVDISVERDVAKTCDDSKVRSLISRIRAAYLDEDEYKALRAEFQADPVGSFFNTINDPCFALLSEEEVEALRNTIRTNFSTRAAALFARYFPGTTTGRTVSRSSMRTFLIILAVVVVAVLAAIVYMRSRN